MVSYSDSLLSTIISAFALVISILSYAINKKQINVLMSRERRKGLVEEVIECLRSLNKTLKGLSYLINIKNIDQIITCISQDLHEKNNLKLYIKYQSLKINNEIIYIDSISDSKEFVHKVRNILFSIWVKEKENIYYREYMGPSIESSIEFTIKPNIVCPKSLDFGDMFTNFIKIESDIINLTRVQFFIEPYDPELYNLLNEGYESILNLFYEAFSKQIHEIVLAKGMTPLDIKGVLYSTVNYDQINKEAASMSIDLGKKANELKRELAIHYLTN